MSFAEDTLVLDLLLKIFSQPRMQTLVLLPKLLLNTRFERVKYISTQQMN